MVRSLSLVFIACALLNIACKKSGDAPSKPVPAPPPVPVATAPTAAPAPVPAAVPATAPAAASPTAWSALDVTSALPARAAAVAVLSTEPEAGKHIWTQLEHFAGLLGISGKVGDALRFLGLGLLNPFDPIERNAWSIAEGRHFAIALLARGQTAIGVFPTSSPAGFLARFKKQLTAQGLEVTTQTVPGGPLFLARQKGVVRLAYYQKGTLALIAPGSEDGTSPERILTDLASPDHKPLSSDPQFLDSTRALQRLGEGLIYFDGEGLADVQRQSAQSAEERESIQRVYEVMKGLAVTLHVTKSQLHAEISLRLGKSGGWDKLFLPPSADFALASHLARGAGGVVRLELDLHAVLQKVLSADVGAKDALGALVARLEKRIGVNLEKDLLANLAGPTAFALYGLAPSFLRALADDDFELALRSMRATIAAGLKDGARAQQALDRAASFQKDGGAADELSLLRKQHKSGPYYELRSKAGALLSVALRGKVLLVGLGKGQMRGLLAREGADLKTALLPNLDTATQAALKSSQNLAAHADLDLLGTWAKGLAKSAEKRHPGVRAVLQELLPMLARKARDVRLTARHEPGRLFFEVVLTTR